MPRHQSSSFTLVEFLAAIAIVAALIAAAIFFTGPYTVWARQSAGHEIYAVLNDEVNRYKGNGGNIAALTAGAPMNDIFAQMQTPVVPAGMPASLAQQFMNSNYTYPGRSLAAVGSGQSYHFYRVDAFNDGTGPAAAPSVVFVAVGSNCCATSPDGINWTSRTIPVATYLSSAYGNGMFVALSRTSVAASSPDGINWTQRSLPSGPGSWTGVTYANSKFVAVDAHPGKSSNIGATSPDGINWTQQTLPATTRWFVVAYGNNTFCAITNNTTVAGTSPDGVSWTPHSVTALVYNAIAYGNGLFVAVGSGCCSTSPDGVTWTQQTIPAGGWAGIAYGNSTFVAVAGNGNVAVTSPDGITWTSNTISLGLYTSVTYANGLFAAVGSNCCATSPDGVTWTQQTIPAGGYNSVTAN